MAVVSLVVLCVGIIALFNTGQMVSKKVQLVNAADAAAYSAAVQQARVYNLIAYMNRATVANEVAMAQMVSWYSWTNFSISAADHFKDALQLVSYVLDVFGVGEVLQAVVNVLQQVESGLKTGRDVEQKVFDGVATIIATLNGVYSQTSRALVSLGSLDVANVARKVVQMNDPKARMSAIGTAVLAGDVYAARRYVRHFNIPLRKGQTSKGADRFANIVMEARDPFSRQRNGHWGLSFWRFSLNLNKRGGTDLVGYRDWVGLDTLGLAAGWPCWRHWHISTCHTYLPMAWGGGAAVDHIPSAFSSLARRDHGWSDPYIGKNPQYPSKGRYGAYSGALSNGPAGRLSLSEPALGGSPWIKPYGSGFISRMGGTVGLPDYDDIARNKATVPYLNGKSAAANGVSALDVGPVFTVVVEEPISNVRTSSHVKGIGGPPDFDVHDKAVANRISALSSAQVYFSRSRHLFPRLFDTRDREMGNLFSPYWQARLVDTPCKVRELVAVSHGAIAPCM